jgi:hypothetical protein
VGVDAQLVASWDRARGALRSRRYWSLVGLLILGCALAAVGYLAAVIFAMQQSAGITTAQALARLGMDSSTWLVSRAALSVILVCLSGWTRYHPPAATSAADERAALERELELEPLRARKALGWRELAGQMIQGAPATGSESAPAALPDAPQSPPKRQGPGSPSAATPRVARSTGTQQRPAVLRLTPDRPTRRAAARGAHPKQVRTATVEPKVRAVWRPDMTVGQLERAAGVSRSTAHKWRKVLRAEEEGKAQ